MISLVKIDQPSKRKLFEDWLQQPHVARWWGDANLRLEQFDKTPSTQHAFIALSNVPIGYLRWQVVERASLDAVDLTGIPDGSIDVDMFLGEEERLNSGFGPMALDILAAQLAKTTKAPLAGLCTSTENHRAIRAFEKAAFSKHSKYCDPTFGPCIVMARWLQHDT